MKNAKELMLEYTASSVRDPRKAAEMFAGLDQVFCRVGRIRKKL